MRLTDQQLDILLKIKEYCEDSDDCDANCPFIDDNFDCILRINGKLPYNWDLKVMVT